MIRQYREEDYEMVMSWLDARGMPRVHPNVLSTLGFIIPDVAVVWLYATNSDVCNIENLYSNPKAENKNQQINFLIDTAIKSAKNMNYKFIQSVTKSPAVIKHALKFGAKMETGQTLITLQIQ